MTIDALPAPGSVNGFGASGHVDHGVRRLTRARPKSVALSEAEPLMAKDQSAQGHSTYTVPAHRVREFARLASRHGWERRAILEAAGIAPASFDQPCPRVTVGEAVEVMRRLWFGNEDKFLGLGTHPVSGDTLRVLAFALSGAPTLEAGLARVEQFAPVLRGMPVPAVSSCAGQTTVSFDLAGFDQQMSLVADTALVVTHRVINWGTRRRLRLLQVDVPYGRPRGETDHDVIFGAPVRFDAPRAALTFSSDFLAAPLVRRQDEIEQLLADVPTALMSEIDFYTTHAQRVCGMIERCLGDHLCTADEIAAGFGISRQTLRRRLREEDTSVSDIRDGVLRQAALTSLVRGEETVAALACRLGFSEPSALTRAFRRWTGQSPTAFLRQHTAPDLQDAAPYRLSPLRHGGGGTHRAS